MKEAIESIEDNGLDNRYVVDIGPGIFVEDTVTMKDYVHVVGSETRGTIIELKNGASTDDLILFDVGHSFSSLKNCLLRNVTNGACIKYKGGIAGIENVRFYGTSKCCIDAYDVGRSGTLGNSLQIINCSTAIVYNTPLILRAADDGDEPLDIFVHAFYTNVTHAGIPAVAEIGVVSGGARGINTKVVFESCNFIGTGSGCAIKVADGSDTHVLGSIIEDFGHGIHVLNEGQSSEIEIISNLIYDNEEYDVWVEQPTAKGSISGTSNVSKISIHEQAEVSVLIQGSEDGSLVVSGDFYQGATFSDITNMTSAMTTGPACGVVSGGSLSISSGRLISVGSGSGYVQHIVNGSPHVQFVEWQSDDIEVDANANTSIYIDINGHIGKLTGTGSVNFFTQIFLGRVVTDASAVVLLINSYRDAVAASTKYDKLFRLYLGPIYRSGSIVTSSGLTLNVGQGDYVVSTNVFTPSGGTPVTFSTWYRNGGWFTITSNQTNVPVTHYDGGSGLVALTGVQCVKHALYTYGHGATEKYFLVYGQEVFANVEAALAGSLPSTPSPFSASAVCIAGIVVQKDAATIANILDQRPTLVTRSNAITSTSIHGNLQLLDADDHKQYVLVDGDRAMAGDLDMGTYNIINVGNVDGVDISSHAARHTPSGLDPLETAAPVANLSAVSTNEVGVQNKFAKSDHWHAIDAYSNGTAGGLVKLDEHGDFSANEISADLSGDVTGNVTGDVTGNVTGDVTGNVTGNVSGTAENITGVAVIAHGGTNSSAVLNNDRIVVSSSGAIVEASAITIGRVLVSNASGIPIASTVTDTELGYVSGVTSGIQSQLNAKQATITGAATTIAGSDLTASRALTSNASGKVTVSTVTDTELGYVSGVTSGIQSQLNSKQVTITGAATTIVGSDLTASRALTSNASGKVVASTVTDTELGYVSGVTSGIQSQLNAKQVAITGAATTIAGSNLTALMALTSDVNGKVTISSVTNAELGYVSGVTSGIQSQLNAKQATITGAATTIVGSDLTVSRVLTSSASGKVTVSSVTDTELGYVSGVTSGIQSQLNAKISSSGSNIDATNMTINGDTILPVVTLDLTSTNGANTNLVLPHGSFFVITNATGNFSINGFAATGGNVNGRKIIIYNSTTRNMTITDNATSTAANQILTLTGGNVASTGTCSFTFIYSSTSSRWILVSSSL